MSKTKNQGKKARLWPGSSPQTSSKLNGDGSAEPLAPWSLEKAPASLINPERGRFTSHKRKKILGIQTWDLWYFLKASGTVELYVKCVNTYVKQK